MDSAAWTIGASYDEPRSAAVAINTFLLVYALGWRLGVTQGRLYHHIFLLLHLQSRLLGFHKITGVIKAFNHGHLRI